MLFWGLRNFSELLVFDIFLLLLINPCSLSKWQRGSEAWMQLCYTHLHFMVEIYLFHVYFHFVMLIFIWNLFFFSNTFCFLIYGIIKISNEQAAKTWYILLVASVLLEYFILKKNKCNISYIASCELGSPTMNCCIAMMVTCEWPKMSLVGQPH